MTSAWKKAIRAKRRAARKYIKEKTKENWELRRQTRNEATRLRRKAVREYWKNQSTKLQDNPDHFYKAFMPFLSAKKKNTSNDLSLNIEGTICHDQNKVVNYLSEHFANIADGIGSPDRSTIDTHVSVSSIREKSVGHNSIHIHSQCSKLIFLALVTGLVIMKKY